MASVFKRNGKWIAAFKGADGRWKNHTAGTDKGEAARLANLWEHEAKLRRDGLVDPKADGYKAADAQDIAGHVTDYENSLRDRGRTERHATLTANRVRALFKKAAITRVTDIRPAAVHRALAELKADQGLSAASVSHYLRAAKLFSRWLAREGRAREDALSSVTVKVVISKADRKHTRRALTHDEFTAIVRHVPDAPTRCGMSGADRAMLYRVAVGSGFRASELASLRPESFDLAGDEPCITVAAGYSKRGKQSGRDDVQPINADLAAALAKWLKGKAKGVPVFAMPPTQHVAEMFKADLRTARAQWIREAKDPAKRRARWIHEAKDPLNRRERRKTTFLAYADDSGHVADFHALRHTFVSWLVASGAPVSVCQQLARHSTPTLTIGVYSHPTLADHRAALRAIASANPNPAVGPESPAMRATGTDHTLPLPDPRRAERAQKAGGIFEHFTASHGTTKNGAGRGGDGATNVNEYAGKLTLVGNSDATGRSGIRTRDKRICNPPH